jgi:DNA-binding NarL/FixJ family response regulator
MDLREEVLAFRGHYRETFNWILQAGGTRSVVLAMGDRFPLLMLAQVLVRPMKLRAAVTTEAEALASVGLHRPDLLVCSDWLESGGVVSLVREARQEVPGMGVLMLLSHQDRGLRAADLRSLDQLVDAMVHEDDLNADDAPLGAAFIALCLGQRYRSPSLLAREWPPPAVREPQGARLTPREEEVLGWLARGLKDRQIAEAMGLSYETVRNYVKTVRGKLGGGSRVEAAKRYWAL